MPQVIQADAVKDIEWLNRWLNCFLDDKALEVFEAQLLDAKKLKKQSRWQRDCKFTKKHSAWMHNVCHLWNVTELLITHHDFDLLYRLSSAGQHG